MDILVRRSNEAFEQGMRLVRLALKFWMKLACDKEWMFFHLDYFNELSVG